MSNKTKCYIYKKTVCMNHHIKICDKCWDKLQQENPNYHKNNILLNIGLNNLSIKSLIIMAIITFIISTSSFVYFILQIAQ